MKKFANLQLGTCCGLSYSWPEEGSVFPSLCYCRMRLMQARNGGWDRALPLISSTGKQNYLQYPIGSMYYAASSSSSSFFRLHSTSLSPYIHNADIYTALSKACHTADEGSMVWQITVGSAGRYPSLSKFNWKITFYLSKLLLPGGGERQVAV